MNEPPLQSPVPDVIATTPATLAVPSQVTTALGVVVALLIAAGSYLPPPWGDLCLAVGGTLGAFLGYSYPGLVKRKVNV